MFLRIAMVMGVSRAQTIAKAKRSNNNRSF